jgi:hypothetical protein
MEVSVIECFQAGHELIIGQGTPEEEVVTIAGFGTILLAAPLAHNHAAGTPLAINGATAPLTASGFMAVTGLCCPGETETFFNRLLASMGLDVCSKSHVQGLMHWFSCVPDMDYQYLMDVINNGNPCKYWTASGSACPALSEECEGKWCR